MWWSPTLPEVVDPGYASPATEDSYALDQQRIAKPQTSYAKPQTCYAKP